MKTNLSFIRLVFKVWINPRKVIKIILENEPGYFVWPIVIAFSFLNNLQHLYLYLTANNFFSPYNLFRLFFRFPTQGVLFFLLITWVIFRVGKWFGGIGTYIEIKTAYVWAYPPAFVGLILMNLGEIPIWWRIFHGQRDYEALLEIPQFQWQQVLMALSFLFVFWTLVLCVINVAQAHKISVWKSIVIEIIFLILAAILTEGIYYFGHLLRHHLI